jgi:hypothetical protein
LTLDGAFSVPVFAPLVVGDTFVGEEYDGATIPGEVVLGNVAPAVFVHARAADVVSLAREVLYLDFGPAQNFVYAFARDGSSVAPIRTYTPASLGQTNFTANDTHVVVWQVTPSITGDVEVFDRATGASLGTFAHGAEVKRCTLGTDGDTVFVCGVNTGAFDVRSLSIAGSLSLNWSYDHLGAVIAFQSVQGVVQFGRYLYLRGSTSSHASLATMRAIEAATGDDLTGEGGGVSTLPNVWNSTLASNGPIDTDGKIVVTATTNALAVVNVFDGSTIATLTRAVAVTGVGIDDDLIYAGQLDTDLIAYSRKDGFVPVWMYRAPAGNIGPKFSVDGGAVFVANSGGGAGEQTPRISRGNTSPRLWRRVDPATDIGLPPHGRGVI